MLLIGPTEDPDPHTARCFASHHDRARIVRGPGRRGAGAPVPLGPLGACGARAGGSCSRCRCPSWGGWWTRSGVYVVARRPGVRLREDLAPGCVIAGAEVRLDTDYAPEPHRPAWAQPVEAKWQQALSAEAIRLGLQP